MQDLTVYNMDLTTTPQFFEEYFHSHLFLSLADCFIKESVHLNWEKWKSFDTTLVQSRGFLRKLLTLPDST